MSATPIGALLCADSLIGARSGIDPQALEVGRQLRQTPVGGELALLVGERCVRADELDTLSEPTTPVATRGAARALAATIPGTAGVHAMRQRRRMNWFAAALAQRVDGRAVYHEANLITRPFDGVTVLTVPDIPWPLCRASEWSHHRRGLPDPASASN
jgi:hypothetical protein